MNVDPDVSPADIAEIRRILPKAAFKRSPVRFLQMFLHVVVVFSCFRWASMIDSSWAMSLAVLVAGHSLLCLGFLAHDLSHGSILKPGSLRSVVEMLVWGFNLLSRTVWRKVHNQTHHPHFGTLRDPDRQFVEVERNRLTWAYSFLLLPNRETVNGNPLMIIQLLFYNFRNLLAAFYPGDRRPSFVPAKPDYCTSDRCRILVEILIALVLQAMLMAAAGFKIWNYLFLCIGSYTVTSALSMAYIFTNHALHPVRSTTSLLEGCTSVIVPGWCDLMHSYFSFHVEHHLFPTLNPRFYPEVSAFLERRFPDKYRRIPITHAWRQLTRRNLFDPNPESSTVP